MGYHSQLVYVHRENRIGTEEVDTDKILIVKRIVLVFDYQNDVKDMTTMKMLSLVLVSWEC